MKKLKLLLCLLAAAAVLPGSAKEYRVSLPEVAAALRQAGPGDRIVVKDGDYRARELKWRGARAEGAPGRIEAATPGGV
ncbi:MAG: hypothetical protein K2L06_04435, partial [Alistipes sp.]|nr:hypothetical protein [Alistipes sp.]